MHHQFHATTRHLVYQSIMHPCLELQTHLRGKLRLGHPYPTDDNIHPILRIRDRQYYHYRQGKYYNYYLLSYQYPRDQVQPSITCSDMTTYYHRILKDISHVTVNLTTLLTMGHSNTGHHLALNLESFPLKLT